MTLGNTRALKRKNLQVFWENKNKVIQEIRRYFLYHKKQRKLLKKEEKLCTIVNDGNDSAELCGECTGIRKRRMARLYREV